MLNSYYNKIKLLHPRLPTRLDTIGAVKNDEEPYPLINF
ncbi:hypothetical protein Dtox_0248 [Desulfofarcimen acetoxidans DSM 771]|jgi:hypothetical protein|uniref:Uncharacterized protein n=1 Tax=Desulfofarcimen acetoxidans (strain ATCC 49208 / DSM 771 / KCTC 5769 / VKM B-1644 / 5575) TaxID=485916 RepID=C8W3U7_DESAS|nr:hypothetical protein Dtox_0248 [Desulfofarcimen acetoxidans DSM 771]